MIPAFALSLAKDVIGSKYLWIAIVFFALGCYIHNAGGRAAVAELKSKYEAKLKAAQLVNKMAVLRIEHAAREREMETAAQLSALQETLNAGRIVIEKAESQKSTCEISESTIAEFNR